MLVQWLINCYVFSSLKETNWIINNGVCVLLFDVLKHLLLRKTYVLKTFRKSKFLGKGFEEMLALKSKKVHGISGKKFFWHYYLPLFFVYKSMPQISFKLICSGDKRFLSEFLRKWGWFQGHNERFPKDLS